MACIKKRGDFQYQAQIRRKGYPAQTKTFETRELAKAWAREQESKMDQGVFRDLRPMARITLSDALDLYRDKIVPKKAPGGQRNERNRIRLIQKHGMASKPMSELCAADFSSYRDERLKQVGNNTVRLELALLSHLYTIAIKEWSWPVHHLLKDITRPRPPDGRERRLEGDEEARLLKGAEHERVKKPLWLIACIRLAIQTGLRAGELLTLQWSQVDVHKGTLKLTVPVNGSKRTVGLTLAAVEILEALPRDTARVIPGYYETGDLDCDFKAARIAAGIEDFHFHDLRHEAASRFAPHMHVQDLAKTMGWKTLQMAMRYYNPKDEEIVNRVRAVEAARAVSPSAPPPPAVPSQAGTASEPARLPASKVPVMHTMGNVIQLRFGQSA